MESNFRRRYLGNSKVDKKGTRIDALSKIAADESWSGFLNGQFRLGRPVLLSSSVTEDES